MHHGCDGLDQVLQLIYCCHGSKETGTNRVHGCGISWYQYDWRICRETCATGPAEWGRRNPFNLVTCNTGSRVLEDPFNLLPLLAGPSSLREASLREENPQVMKPRQSSAISGSSRKKGGLCRLFNKAPGDCPYGKQCIFIHRCSLCRSMAHGGRNCPEDRCNKRV